MIVLLLLAGAPLPAADTLPAYCGAVGANSYTPPTVAIPAVVLNRGTVITVTNATMAINGDTSSVAALVANPGPDGISLQEAVMATNNSPGTWNIQFAPALKGSTIVVDSGPLGGLSFLSGGNVTINGDINGDGQPDITLTSQSGNNAGIYVVSGGNTLNGLALNNFTYGVWISPPAPGQPGSGGGTFSNITISNLTLTNIQNTGIGVNPPSPNSAASQGTFDHVLIVGNTITGNASGPMWGILVDLGSTTGATLQHTTIANNNINLPTTGAKGVSVDSGTGLGATKNQALDTLIANNVISSLLPEVGIRVATGVAAASSNLIDGMQVIGNRILITGPPVEGAPGTVGMELFSGDAASDDAFPSLRPIQYSENNIIRNLSVLSNTIQGGANFGIELQVACCGNANNTITGLSILGNTIDAADYGMQLGSGASGGAYSRPSTGNTLSNVLVQANTIQMTPACNCYPAGLGLTFGGIVVIAGEEEPGNNVTGISIANNDVNTPLAGISIIGGVGGSGLPNPPISPADNNVVSSAQISCNQIDQAPTMRIDFPGTQGIDVTGGLLNANGNQVQQLTVVDNLVAGVLGGASLFANLGSGFWRNPGTTTGDTISISQISGGVDGPAITSAINAEGGAPLIAPNTWIAIAGTNLAASTRSWLPSDFVSNQMPTQLDGVSVTVNGESAYLYYVNPSQVNALTPPDAMQGTVNVVVNNNGVSSQTYTAQAQAISPSFFVFDGTHVVATHLNGTDIGPPTLYPGLTTPASPGETIVIYANGFGQTSVPVVSGSMTQSGTLSPLPVITISGIQANVRFAGLNNAPGEFQFNVDVPSNVPDGDQPLTATYNGVATQLGVVLTVQH